jgi:hypothetical protein
VDEVAAGVTDLLLGAVLFACAGRLQRTAGVHRYWALMLWSAGAGALAGAAHHLLFVGSRRASDLSWVVVGVLIAVAISYLLAATATEVLGRRLARLFIGVRVAGLLAYVVVLAAVGIGSRTGPLVVGESVTMAAIVGLWWYALYAGHPGAGRMLVAIAVCALPAVFFALPVGALSGAVGLDARALQHLGQIPGVLLICRVITAVPSSAAGPGPPEPGNPAPAVRDSITRNEPRTRLTSFLPHRGDTEQGHPTVQNHGHHVP